MTKEVYDNLFDKITDNAKSWKPGKLYKNSSFNFYWLVNRSGRLHVRRIEKVNICSKDKSLPTFSNFEILDYLINYDGSMTYKENYGMFKTEQEAREFLNNLVNKNNEE